MNLLKSYIQFLMLLWTILPVLPVLASDTDPSVVSVEKTFTVQMDKSKDCQALSQYSLLVKGIDSGLHPVGCDPSNKKLTFELQRDPAAQNSSADVAWKAMLGSPWDSEKGFQRSMNFTVTQPAASGVIAVSSGTFTLALLKPAKALLGSLIVIVVLISLFYLGSHSGLVRDQGNPGTKLQDRSFSLARVQMAWWFAIILACYIFLWVVTGDMTVLSSQALGLMGISGASGLVSAGLDKGKKTVFPISEGKFFDDILTDADGVTLHRFQMLVMTVVLGIMFVIHVATQLSMPDFDSNTLALMGISAGTYLGFKVPEQQINAPDNGKQAGNSTVKDDPKSGYEPAPDSPSK